MYLNIPLNRAGKERNVINSQGPRNNFNDKETPSIVGTVFYASQIFFIYLDFEYFLIMFFSLININVFSLNFMF